MRLIAAILLIFASSPLLAQTIQVNKDNRTVAVTATGEADAPADLAVVSIGFVNFGIDQNQTYAEGTRISNAVMDAVRAANVLADAIESKEQSLTAVGEEDRIRFAKGLRFRCSQSWQVTVSATSAASLLHIAILAGANDSGSIQWKLRSETAIEVAAAHQALARAREMADRLASGLGSKLGALVYASDQVPRGPFGLMQMNTQSASVSSRAINLKPLAISPDRISTTATVYAVFAIE